MDGDRAQVLAQKEVIGHVCIVMAAASIYQIRDAGNQ